jgi:NADH-quinone oxidoreductase subunit C
VTQTSEESVNPNAEETQPEIIEEIPFSGVKRSEFRSADNTKTFIVPVEQILAVMSYLKNEGGFVMLEDLTALDWYPKEPRFQVVYNLIALARREVMRIKVELPGKNPTIPSMTGIWKSANWYEREVFDLFGIIFTDHPNLTRIQMPEDWEGHPLRKDYPLTGPRRPNLPANQIRLDGRSRVDDYGAPKQ